MSVDPIKPVALTRDGPSPRRGLPVGDMRGFARVRDDAALASLSLDRSRGPVMPSRPEHPLLSLHVDGDVRWVAGYVPGTNVLETTGRTESAELRIVDFMPVAEGRAGQAEAVAAGSFIRIVTCTEGEASFRMVCAAAVERQGGTHGVSSDGWHVASSAPMAFGDDVAMAAVRLVAGESIAFALSVSPVDGGAPLVARALHALGDTIHYWTWWSDRCRYKGDDFDSVLRDALTLKLSCHGGDGLMVDGPGATGFSCAPRGDAARAAASFLALGYRHECVELLAQVMLQPPMAACDTWAADHGASRTLAEYVDRYGTAGLPPSLVALHAASDVPAASASK